VRGLDLGLLALAGLIFTALRHGRELHPPASHRWIGLCAWLASLVAMYAEHGLNR
jgi:hypothetical protein